LRDSRLATMSSAISMTLPLRQLEVAAQVPRNLTSNNNLGTGTQKSSQQTGGCHNTQFTAETINYHGELTLDTRSLALRSTNGSGVRTNKDTASAVIHRALLSRYTLCRPTRARRARREAFCMEQKSCTSRPRRCRVRGVYSALDKQKADNV
jgi:hypothetical protein